MVEVDALVISLPALGQEGAVLEHPVELHDGQEQAESVEAHGHKVRGGLARILSTTYLSRNFTFSTMASAKDDFNQDADYEVADQDYDQGADPDYDEGSQDADYEVSDADAPEASQEYYKRSQK